LKRLPSISTPRCATRISNGGNGPSRRGCASPRRCCRVSQAVMRLARLTPGSQRRHRAATGGGLPEALMGSRLPVPWTAAGEGGLRMRTRWTKLFPRRCPMCKTGVRRGSAAAVRGCGRWCCSQSHADADACRLDEPPPHVNGAMPRATASTCRDSGLPPCTWPSLAPLEWDQGRRAAVAPGSPHAASRVACRRWEMTGRARDQWSV
jgi:hypothetical protein